MTKEVEIAEYLDNCPTVATSGCVARTGLIAIHKSVFNHTKSVPKLEIVSGLSEFYADDKNIIGIWDSLNECERDFITYFVQYGGVEYLPTTLEYAKKHNLKLEYKTSSGYIKNVFNNYDYSFLKFLHLLTQNMPETRTHLLFPNGREMPPFIFATLQTVIEPLKCEYKEYAPTKTEYVICRENRLGDFAAVVRFASTEQLKVAEGTFDLTKSKLIKMIETIGFDEVCDKDGKFSVLRETKRYNNFKVAPLLFALVANSKLVEVDDTGNVSPGKRSTELLMLPPHEFAKKIFTDYARENNIYDLHYVPYVTVHGGAWWIKWNKCREPIFELLKSCPVETFIKFQDFNKYVQIFCNNFFKQILSYAIDIRGPNYGYNPWGIFGPNWDEREAHLIQVILSFLSTIGMIDIAYMQNIPRTKHSNDTFYVGIAGFRITKLGAWILGITDKYETPANVITQNVEGELLVLPDYSVVISGLKCRIEHETYLSRFFTHVSSDENAAVYKLDFKSIARAYSNGLTPAKIQKYLTNASSKPLPDNVERVLADWQAKVGRIKIREIFVLETDDKLLLEEIKHIKAMGNIITGNLPHAVIIANDSQKKAKTILEKNGWLVKI